MTPQAFYWIIIHLSLTEGDRFGVVENILLMLSSSLRG